MKTQSPGRAQQQSPNREHWQAHAKAQKKSGLNRAEYCRQHKLSYHSLTYWQKKLSISSLQKSTLVPVPVKPLFQQRTMRSGSGLKISAGNLLTIEIEDHFTPATLVKILQTLEIR
jgi:hypothetical protein